ncbi:hypothetical protein PR001_g25860 [Phytophthora rubi]|uniref:Uncharacterized protein n=1 Tax=Phytophthora rubi TaxID=129364 RepID=A0A6A3HW27_9STRA|nr:hypothetical protein PR001_g25860 [Phytophthora rubi]
MDDFEKAEREYKAAKELAMNEKARSRQRMTRRSHNRSGSSEQDAGGYSARHMPEEKNPSKSVASLAAAQAEFEAAKVDEKDALELKEILVKPVFAMTKDIASTKSKSVNTPLYHAARQVFEEVMPDVIEFYDDE